MGVVDSSKNNDWLSFIVDHELRRELEREVSGFISDDHIRAAFVLLERRIRQSAGLSGNQFGKDLIDAAFSPENGLLQPVSPVGAERAGLHHFLLGMFLYYRNPIAHRSVYHDPQSARQICFLIDHALTLIRKSAELVINLREFVGAHEGQVVSRRDFRLDIDGDGQEEVLVLTGLGPSLDDGKLIPHLAPVILKKGAEGYSRIPCELVRGWSLHGPIKAELRHVTSVERPDIIVYWAWGETQALILILKREGSKYVLALREIPPGMKEPYSSPEKIGFTEHGRKRFDFADVDGDGCAEMIQSLSFDDQDKKDMGYGAMNYAVLEKRESDFIDVCRVWKWDDVKGQIVQIEERPVVRR